MNLRAEYEKHLAAQQALPKLDAKARSFGSTTSDRRRAAAARREADSKQFQKKVAKAYAQETRAINSIMPSELQAAVLALVRREMKNMLPHPLRGLMDNYTNYASPLIATLDSEGEAYWGPGQENVAFEYRSFFRVVVNVTGTGFIVCVTPGSDSPDGETYCGAVKINGVRVNVPIVCQTYTDGGHVVAWLHSWLDSFGAHADIVFGSDKNTPPGNPNGGFAFGSQLLGEVTVVEQAGAFLLNDLKQHYLRGGEHTEILVGECDEYWHWISPPPSGT